MKRQVKFCPIAKGGVGIVGIPGSAGSRLQLKISLAQLGQHIQSVIFNRDMKGFPRLDGLRQDHAKIRVLFFLLLHKIQLAIVFAAHNFYPEGAEKIEWQKAHVRYTHLHRHHVFYCQPRSRNRDV